MTKKKEERMYEQDCNLARKILDSLKADEVERPARVLAIALGIGLGIINNADYMLDIFGLIRSVSLAMNENLKEEGENDGKETE